MPDFDKIRQAARRRVGDAELRARMPEVGTSEALRAIADDRYLSLMSRRIFRAGLSHSLVDARWPAFEEVFHGFDLRRVRAMNDEEVESLMSDRRLIRHWGKIKSVPSNATAMQQLAEQHAAQLQLARRAGIVAGVLVGLGVDADVPAKAVQQRGLVGHGALIRFSLANRHDSGFILRSRASNQQRTKFR